MNEQWIQYLCDPLDRSELRLVEVREREDDWIISGKLVNGTGAVYPIERGIPIFVTNQTQSKESVESFAYEWNQFGFLYAKSGWESDVVNPLVQSSKFFQDKIVVDAGAGSGAQSRWIAEAGAKLVFALELNDGIFSAVEKSVAPFRNKIFPIQCDIAHPPLRVKPDVLYCFNVIQHTTDPAVTFGNLAELLPAHGSFLFNIYTKRLEARYQMTRAIRRLVRFLPFAVWRWVSFLVAVGAHPASLIPGMARPVNWILPTSHSFKETWLDIYDVFGPHHFQAYMTRAEQFKMVREHGLEIVRESKFGYLLQRSATASGHDGESKREAPETPAATA